MAKYSDLTPAQKEAYQKRKQKTHEILQMSNEEYKKYQNEVLTNPSKRVEKDFSNYKSNTKKNTKSSGNTKSESTSKTQNTFIPLEDSNGRTQSELYRIKENNKTTSRVEKNIADRYRQRIEDTKKLFGNDLILPNDNDYLNITPEQVKSIIASKEAAIDWQRRVKPKSGTSPNYQDRYGKQHIIADLEDQIEKYKQYLNELNYNIESEKRKKEGEKYSNLKNNSDYKKYVNQSKNGLLKNFARQANQYNIDHTFFMTDEERNNYLYIYNKQGRKEARKYMEWLEPELNRRYSEDVYSTAERMGREHPVSSTALSVLGSPLMSVSSGAAHIKNAITQNVDPYDPLTAQSKYSDVVRQSVMDNHIESDVGKFLYGAGTSLGDAAVNTIVAGAVAGFAGSAYGLSASATKKLTSAITTGLMSSPVAVSSALEAKARGKSDSEAVLIGSVYAGASWLTEKYSIERILNAKTLIGAIGTSAITEGSEEIAENWAGRIIDIFAYGDENQLTQSYNYYREQGFNKTEAIAAIAKNILKEDALSGAAGAMGGLGFAIGGAVGGYYNTGKSRAAQYMSENVVNGQENINNDTVTDTNPITAEQTAQGTQSQTVNNGQNTPFSNIQQESAQNVRQIQNNGLDNNIPTGSYGNVNAENNFNNTANTVQNDVPKAADFNPDIATKMIKSHGENGAKAFETALQNERAKGNNISRYDFLRYFNKYYAAALVGKSKATVDVNYSDRISQSSATAAYTAGVADKALELENKIKAANNVIRQNGGVLINENSRLINKTSIREVIPFPMSASAQDLMLGAPGEVSRHQLREANIEIR